MARHINDKNVFFWLAQPSFSTLVLILKQLLKLKKSIYLSRNIKDISNITSLILCVFSKLKCD